MPPSLGHPATGDVLPDFDRNRPGPVCAYIWECSDSGILQVLTADFNNDGNPDIVFLQIFRITVVLGNGDGTFQPPIQAPVTATPYFTSMAVGNFNNDGKADVVVFASTLAAIPHIMSKLISVKAMGRSLRPSVRQRPVYVTEPPIVGVVNHHEQNLDLIGPNVVAVGVGDGTFQQPIFSNCAAQNTPGGSPGGGDFTVADFRGDGYLDLTLVFEDVYGGAIFDFVFASGVVCLGNGDGTFTTGPVVYSSNTVADSVTSLPSYRVTTGDFNGHGLICTGADILQIRRRI